MGKIVFVSQLPSTEQQQWLELLQQTLSSESIYFPHQLTASQYAEVDIAIVANPDPEVLRSFPNLVWIHSLWAGVENLVKTGLPDGVQLVRLTDPELAQTMAESVLTWTLYLQRNMPSYQRQQQQREWRQLTNINSKQLRVSVLGAGELGLASLSLLGQLNYTLSCWTRSPKIIDKVTNYTGKDGLTAMLAETDILISLLPLTPETRHLLNNKTLSLLPQGASIINFSRGGIIDHDALLKLLDNQHINHAVLDVFDIEPLPAQSPLWHHPKTTVLPHISAPTNHCTAAEIIADNIGNYRKSGNLPPTVNLNKGY
ncbi:MAG: 2-hydroxyacid dehydrogenase [Psychrobium sp.]